MASISFQSACYEKSYSHMLVDGKLREFIEKFSDINFDEKIIIVNNVDDKQKIKKILDNNYSDFTSYFSDDNPQIVVESLGLNFSNIINGFYYSINHYTGIYYTKCDYILYIGEDNNIDNLDSKFLLESINELEKNNNYIAAFPRWCENELQGAIEESISETDNFYIEYGFTDQLYIIKAKEFKNKIYNFVHPLSNRYPNYTGISFERRIDSYMRCENKLRIVHKNYYYLPGYYDKKIKG